MLTHSGKRTSLNGEPKPQQLRGRLLSNSSERLGRAVKSLLARVVAAKKDAAAHPLTTTPAHGPDWEVAATFTV
jgi:hypothetical protein